MLCPWCNREMKKGFLQSGKPIVFNLEARTFALLHQREGEAALTKQFWTMPTVPAWHCAKCKRVVVEYE